jgi:predicted DNA binding CopG/RHH family protein
MLKKEIQMTTKLNSKQVKDTEEAWDSRALGADEQYVIVADDAHEAALEEALELQAISIRLPKDLIRNYKLIADFHGVGYQPLMRDILHRFVKPALKEILEAQIKAETAKPERPPLVPLKMAA